MTTEKITLVEDPEGYSDSRDLPPLDAMMFKGDSAKLPSQIKMSEINQSTKNTLLTIIDDFEQSRLAKAESKKYRQVALKAYYTELGDELLTNANNELIALLNINNDGLTQDGVIDPVLMAWRRVLRDNPDEWRERIATNDEPRANSNFADPWPPAKGYHDVPSTGHAAAGDY